MLHDSEHPYRGSLESTDPTLEEKTFSTKKRVTAAAAGIALALMVATGVGCGASAKQQDNSTTTEAPANPGQTQAAPAETTAKADIDPSIYTADMERYYDMDMDTFEALPRDERLAYSQYLIDLRVSEGYYDAVFGESSSRHKYMVTPSVASLENTGQQILDINQYNQQLAYLQNEISDARKALSSVYYNVGAEGSVTNAYLQDIDRLEKFNRPIPIVNLLTETDTGEVSNGKDSRNTTVHYKIVTHHTENTKALYERYVYSEFTNYDGSKLAVWLLDGQSLNSLEELKSFGTVR